MTTPALPQRVLRCTTHHRGCDCREWRFERLEAVAVAAAGLVRARSSGVWMTFHHDLIDALAALDADLVRTGDAGAPEAAAAEEEGR